MVRSTSKIAGHWRKRSCQLSSYAVLRTLQFIFAVTVAGIYGVDLGHASKTNSHAQSEWIYAEFIAALSALLSILYLVFSMAHAAWATLDALLCILWVAQVGVFGALYASSIDPDYVLATLSISRMRAAVWVDLINMLLWLTTTVMRIVLCIRNRKAARRTKQSGAGKRLVVVEGVKRDYDEESGRWSGEEIGVEVVTDQTDDKYDQKAPQSLPSSLHEKDSEKGNGGI